MKRERFSVAGVLALAASSWGMEFGAPDVEVEAAPFRVAGEFAVVDIIGPLTQRASWCWDSYEQIRERFDAALTSPSRAVLLRVDSPGGEVAGCFELAEYMRAAAAARQKTLVSFVDGCATSAAYALASAATRVCLPRTGVVGSIGVISVSLDVTELDRANGMKFAVVTSGARKADGHPHVALSEDALAAMQASVDQLAGVFFDLVSSARGIPVSRVAELQAGMFLGEAAVAAGLADEVTSFDALVAMGATGTAQATAHEGAEVAMDEMEKALAALKALAESEDEQMASRARKALKELEDSEDGEESAESEEETAPDAAAEGESEGEQEKPEARASVPLARVERLEKRLDAEERSRLLASRPDLDDATKSFLARQPVQVVRDAVKSMPRRATAKGQVGAARAALGAEATRGEGVTGDASMLPPSEARELDVQMGIARPEAKVRNEGTRQIFPVMTPAQAREALAQKGGAR